MLLKFILTFFFLIILFVLMSRQQYILASLAASFPSFTFLTYFASKEPRITALYLAVFTLIISITMFSLYFLKFSQTTNTIIGIVLWLVLSVIATILFYKVGGAC